ncbi:MAG: ATP-binding cassette domain-containing protein [Synechococcaceae cyanobacterium SM1_2_3]|nr:ATP-binding cassette domain-containing protein [Synechococcaceae cyanobacterium SM1_2_3]
MIWLNNVSVRRGATEVLHSLSTEIPAATVTAVVGRSGVGKTTLLGALNGLLRPSAGQISITGVGPLDDASLHAHRRNTATVFQHHALIDRLNALDNVLLGMADTRHPLSLLPWSQPHQRRAAQALDDVGLLHYARTRVDRLSGGERQRVGLARALVRTPRLLLGDEPFAAVDPGQARQLGSTLRNLADQQGMTVILVMHQIDMALALADRVIGLADGRIAFDGPASHFDRAAQAQVFPSTIHQKGC